MEQNRLVLAEDELEILNKIIKELNVLPRYKNEKHPQLEFFDTDDVYELIESMLDEYPYNKMILENLKNTGKEIE